MSSRFYYLISLVFVFIIPSIVTGLLVAPRLPLINLVIFVISITILGSVWDVWATRHGKNDRVWLWQFNRKDTLGITIFRLPIEEYIFYIASSVYIIFLWENIKLALETRNTLLYLLIPCLGIWSLLFMLLPRLMQNKR